MKLTKAQLEALKRIESAWALGIHPHAHTVKYQTRRVLKRLGLVDFVWRDDEDMPILVTAKGRRALALGRELVR